MYTQEQLIEIALNLKWMLYGVGGAGAIILLLLGVIVKYLGRKLEKLDELEYIKFRMDGIESFARGVVEINGRLVVLEKMCDRRHREDTVEVDRRGKASGSDNQTDA